MKKWIALLTVTATVVILTSAVRIYTPANDVFEQQLPQEQSQSREFPAPTNVIELEEEQIDESSVSTEITNYYHLARLGSMVALFDEEGVVVEVYEIYVHLLPPEDAMALNEGIRIDSEAQLRQLLEDFGG